jgi:hypothetical protein
VRLRPAKPVQYTTEALALDELVAGAELSLDLGSSLAVFGAGLEDTEQATEEFRRRGYVSMLSLSGERYGGYDWLSHVELT